MSETVVCAICDGKIEWVELEGLAPFWAHHESPEDDHDPIVDDEPKFDEDHVFIRTWATPPDGWVWYGSHRSDGVRLEYSTAQGEDGLPLFEREADDGTE